MVENNFIYNSYYRWWKNIDKFIFLLILSLFFLGLFFSLVSTSLIASDKLDTNSYYFFIKHSVFVLLGLIILICLSFVERNNLLNIRENRPKPFFDDKTQIDLNAYWLSTLIYAAEIFESDLAEELIDPGKYEC